MANYFQCVLTSDLSLRLTNTNLHSGTFYAKQSICNEEYLRIGCCEATEVRFRCSYDGTWLVPGAEVSISFTSQEELPAGIVRRLVFFSVGIVESVVWNDKHTYCDVVIYDKLKKLLTSNVSAWYDNLVFPITLNAMLTSLLDMFGIVNAMPSIGSLDYTVERSSKFSPGQTLSGKEVLESICELCCGFGRMLYIPNETSYSTASALFGLINANTSIDATPYKIATRPTKSDISDLQSVRFSRLNVMEGRLQRYGTGVGQGTTAYTLDNFVLYGNSLKTITPFANYLMTRLHEAEFDLYYAKLEVNPITTAKIFQSQPQPWLIDIGGKWIFPTSVTYAGINGFRMQVESRQLLMESDTSVRNETPYVQIMSEISKVGMQPVLWSGKSQMDASQVAMFTSKASEQTNGIVLVFSQHDADGNAADYNHQSFFIPKKLIELQSGKGSQFPMFSQGFGYACCKYLYIYDNKIRGNANNTASGTASSGVQFDNSLYVLKYVIGV